MLCREFCKCCGETGHWDNPNTNLSEDDSDDNDDDESETDEGAIWIHWSLKCVYHEVVEWSLSCDHCVIFYYLCVKYVTFNIILMIVINIF